MCVCVFDALRERIGAAPCGRRADRRDRLTVVVACAAPTPRRHDDDDDDAPFTPRIDFPRFAGRGAPHVAGRPRSAHVFMIRVCNYVPSLSCDALLVRRSRRRRIITARTLVSGLARVSRHRHVGTRTRTAVLIYYQLGMPNFCKIYTLYLEKKSAGGTTENCPPYLSRAHAYIAPPRK